MILRHDEDDHIITSIINTIYSRSVPGSDLLTRLLTTVSDTFIRELVCIVKKSFFVCRLTFSPTTMAKGVRSILFLLHTSSHLLTPYSDAILDALIVAKRLILEQSNRDIRFLATINLKSVMNKSIRYSKPLCSSSLFRGRSTQRARSKLLYDSVFLFAALLSSHRLYRQLLRICCYSDRCVARVFDDDCLSRVFYGDSFRQCEQNQSVHDDFEGIFHDHQPKSGLFHSVSLAFRANNVLLSLQRSTHFVQVDSPSAPIQTLHVPRLFVSFAS